MTAITKLRDWRPGLRAGVLTVSAALVLVTAAAVASTVSEHLTRAAVNEAVRHAEAVIRGFVDPMFSGSDVSETSPEQAAAINGQLERLVSAHQILRIKVWTEDGTIVVLGPPCAAWAQLRTRGRRLGGVRR